MCAIIYDQLIQGILKMIHKLDIGYMLQSVLPSEANQQEDNTTNEHGRKAADVKGFIFYQFWHTSSLFNVGSFLSCIGKGKEKEDEEIKELTNESKKQDAAITDEEVLVDHSASMQNFQPKIPKDYELFLNLVEFCKLVLTVPEAKSKSSSYSTESTIIKKEEADDTQAHISFQSKGN